MNPIIGTITIFAGTFAPKGWAFCDGALLPVAAHPALFSILGTIYGGDGDENFALPDLRGRAVAHFGAGPQRLGTIKPGGDVTLGKGAEVTVLPTLFLSFIIAMEGVFPQRP